MRCVAIKVIISVLLVVSSCGDHEVVDCPTEGHTWSAELQKCTCDENHVKYEMLHTPDKSGFRADRCIPKTRTNYLGEYVSWGCIREFANPDLEEQQFAASINQWPNPTDLYFRTHFGPNDEYVFPIEYSDSLDLYVLNPRHAAFTHPWRHRSSPLGPVQWCADWEEKGIEYGYLFPRVKASPNEDGSEWQVIVEWLDWVDAVAEVEEFRLWRDW